jgi:glycine oxidase
VIFAAVSEIRKIDSLIIGQGLAGSCLALQLWNKGRDFFVFAKADSNAASKVAAGLFNPITGKSMTKTWRADELFPYLHSFYSEVESFLNEKFYYPTPLYRPFLSVQEQNEWMGKSAEIGLGDYIDQIFASPHFEEQVINPFGGLLLKSCGFVDTNRLMDSVREKLIENQRFESDVFDENEVKFVDGKVRYRGFEADNIIYCNGAGALQSKFFKHLPIRPLKGEVVVIRLRETLDRIYNRGVYVVPAGAKNVYKVGATYTVKDKSVGITSEGKAELMDRLTALIPMPFEVIGQEWGMRPTTPDRKPMLGSHPDHPNVVIFNGLGTKGVSLAPFFSNQLVNWLIGNGEIDPTVNVNRFS